MPDYHTNLFIDKVALMESDEEDISKQIIRCQNRVKYYERLILWCAEELIKLQQRITELRDKRGKSCLLRRLTKTRSQ